MRSLARPVDADDADRTRAARWSMSPRRRPRPFVSQRPLPVDHTSTIFLAVEHPGVGVEDGELVRGADVSDDEGPLVHPPQPFAAAQLGQLGDLHRGETEDLAGRPGFVERLVVQDACRSVPEETLGKAARLRAGVAHRLQVRQPMEDDQVRQPPCPRELPLGLHSGEQHWLGEQAPCLVVHDEALPAARVGEGRFHPRRCARHHETDQGVRGGNRRQVQREHRQARVETDRGRAVEETSEVTAYKPRKGVGGLAAVYAELLHRRAGERPVRRQHGVDDHREDGRGTQAPGGGEGVVKGGVEGRALRRPERPPERRLGEGGEETEPPRSHLGLPGGVLQAGRPRPLVERVEASRSPDTELDGLAADGARHDRPLPLRITGDVHPPPECCAAGGQ